MASYLTNMKKYIVMFSLHLKQKQTQIADKQMICLVCMVYVDILARVQQRYWRLISNQALLQNKVVALKTGATPT